MSEIIINNFKYLYFTFIVQLMRLIYGAWIINADSILILIQFFVLAILCI